MFRLHSGLVTILVVAFSGCASHVQWAPDSKSFLYSHADGSVIRYDVATKESTRITRVEHRKSDGWPVFSQRTKDGLIVVGESMSTGKGTREVTTIIRFVRPDGTELRSNTLSWLAVEEDADNREAMSTYVEWSPRGTHVLVTTKAAVAVHDFEKGTFKVHDEVAPVLPIYFGASPWRPDGKGFLATPTEKQESNDVLFVTLDGEATKIDASKIETVTNEEVWPVGEWSEGTLVTRYAEHQFEIDTTENEIRHTELDEAPVHRWPLGKARLEHAWVEGNPVLTWTNGTEKVEITRDLGKAFTTPTGPVVPAPDGKSAVIVLEKGLVLVGESGIVDRIPVVPGGGDGNR